LSDEQQPLEIEVQKWDANSFTIEGVNDQLEKLLKEYKIIRTLALRNNGKMVRISRDVQLKARKDSTSHLSLRPPLLRIRFTMVQRLNMKDLIDLLHYPVKYWNILEIIVLNLS